MRAPPIHSCEVNKEFDFANTKAGRAPLAIKTVGLRSAVACLKALMLQRYAIFLAKLAPVILRQPFRRR